MRKISTVSVSQLDDITVLWPGDVRDLGVCSPADFADYSSGQRAYVIQSFSE